MKPFVLAMILFAIAVPARAEPDPYVLFNQARTYWQHQRYPRAIGYTVTVQVEYRGGQRVEHYASAFDAMTGDIWVDPISDFELAHPATGRGIGLNLNGSIQPAPDQDFLGVPQISPAYSFSIAAFVPSTATRPLSDAEIVAQVRAQFHDPDRRPKPKPSPTPIASDEGIPEIAAVVAYKRNYTIALLADETVNGHDCYHLHLEPVHPDGRYRLRDIWLEKSSFATERVKTALNFVDGPGTQVPWTIDFTDVGGAHYVASESADRPVTYSSHHYPNVRISFENIHELAGPMPRRIVPFSAYLILTEP